MLTDTTRSTPNERPSAQQLLMALGVAGSLLLLWIASDTLVPQSLERLSAQLQAFVTIFFGIYIEGLAFLLIGVLVSSLIHLYVAPERIQRLCPRSPVLAAIVGALLGLVFPVCECGSIPTARRLMAKGASLPFGLAFLLGAPVMNPIVIASTWIAFGGRLDIVIGRVALTFIIAVVVSLVIGTHSRPQALLAAPLGSVDPHCCTDHDQHDHGHHHAGQGQLQSLAQHIGAEFLEMGRFLIMGALIAATLQTVIPRSVVFSFGQGPVISILVMIGLAVVLSVCSTVDAFVALAFVNTFLPGALLAFLVFGPMVDIKSILMFSTTLRKPVVALMVLLIFLLAFLAAVVSNLYLI